MLCSGYLKSLETRHDYGGYWNEEIGEDYKPGRIPWRRKKFVDESYNSISEFRVFICSDPDGNEGTKEGKCLVDRP
jgi:hypothetical protein